MKLKCCYCLGEDPPDELTEAEIVYDGYSLCLEHLKKYIAEQAELVKQRKRETEQAIKRRKEDEERLKRAAAEVTTAAKGIIPERNLDRVKEVFGKPIIPAPSLDPNKGVILHGPSTLPGPLANFTITPSGGIVQHIYDSGSTRAEIIRRIQEAMRT